mgnify:CR=1 FL=1
MKFGQPHHDPVDHQNFVHRHINFTVVAQPVRLIGAQGMQSADRLGGLALGTRLQPFAQHHQGDDHGRAFKVQVRRVPTVRGEPQPNRQGPACGGAQ